MVMQEDLGSRRIKYKVNNLYCATAIRSLMGLATTTFGRKTLIMKSSGNSRRTHQEEAGMVMMKQSWKKECPVLDDRVANRDAGALF